jgi:hypothetical protein
MSAQILVHDQTETGEHGPRAMTRFVIIQFIEGLQSVAPDRYIFKGGNLLWHYIKTTRSTVDVDFATDVEVEIDTSLKPGQLTSEVVHNYLNTHKYEPATFHKIAQNFGKRGLALATLIQVLSGNKMRKAN